MKNVKLRLKSEKFLPRTIVLHEMKKLFQILYHQRNAAATGEFEYFEAMRDLVFIDLLASAGMRIGEAAVRFFQLVIKTFSFTKKKTDFKRNRSLFFN